MGRVPKARPRTRKEINSYDKEDYYLLKKKKYMRIYNFFVNNMDKSYEEFITLLEKEFKVVTETELNQKNLIRFIVLAKKEFSSNKGEEIKLIFNMMIAKKKGNLEEVSKIEDIIKKLRYKSRTLEEIYKDNKNNQSDEAKNDIFNAVSNDIETVIDKKESYNTLYEKGEIKRHTLLTDAKQYIHKIGFDRYLDFILSNYNLKSISIDEINKVISDLENDLSEYKSKLDRLNSLNPKSITDEIEIRNINVLKQEELNKFFTNSTPRLYNWKISRINRIIECYSILYNLLNSFMAEKDLSTISSIDEYKISIIRNNDAYFNIYKKLLYIAKVYTFSIQSLKNVTDEEANTIVTNYKKRLLLEK